MVRRRRRLRKLVLLLLLMLREEGLVLRRLHEWNGDAVADVLLLLLQRCRMHGVLLRAVRVPNGGLTGLSLVRRDEALGARTGTGSLQLLNASALLLHLRLQLLLLEDVHLAVRRANRTARTGLRLVHRARGSRWVGERTRESHGRRGVGTGELDDERITLGAHGLRTSVNQPEQPSKVGASTHIDVSDCVRVLHARLLRTSNEYIPKDRPPPARLTSVQVSEPAREKKGHLRRDALVKQPLRSLDGRSRPSVLVNTSLLGKPRRGFCPSSFLQEWRVVSRENTRGFIGDSPACNHSSTCGDIRSVRCATSDARRRTYE